MSIQYIQQNDVQHVRDIDEASEIETLPPPVDETQDQDEDPVEENQTDEEEVNDENDENDENENTNKDQGPTKVFVYLGCAIMLLFLLKELMGLFVLLGMLNLMMFAIDPVGTQELRRIQLEVSKKASEIIIDDMKKNRL